MKRKLLLFSLMAVFGIAASWADNVAKIGDQEYETLNAAFNAAQDGETVTLISDVTLTSRYAFSKTLTLDLNGHTITSSVSNNYAFAINNNGNLTVNATAEGSAFVNNGSSGFFQLLGTSNSSLTVNGGNWSGGGSHFYFGSSSVTSPTTTLTLNNLTATTSGHIVAHHPVYANPVGKKTATLIVNGGTYTHTNTSSTETSSAFFVDAKDATFDGVNITSDYGHCIYVLDSENEIVFKDNTFKRNTSNQKNCAIRMVRGYAVIESGTYDGDGGYGAYLATAAHLTIKGGEIKGTTSAVCCATANSSVTIDGGTINGDLGNSNQRNGITIFSGTFSVDLSKNAYKDMLHESVTYTNVDGKYVAKQTRFAKIVDNGTTAYYETLKAAFDAATDGQTITMIWDASGDGIKVPQGKFNTNGLTVDFKGFTYTVTGNAVGSSGTERNGMQLLKDNSITFKNGTITALPYNDSKVLFLVQNYSNLTLKGMTLKLDDSRHYKMYTLSNNNGNVVIEDTKIYANSTYPRYYNVAFDVCRYSSYNSVSVTVKGDSYIQGYVEVDASNGDAKSGFSLNLEGGSFDADGKIIVTDNAAKAMASNPTIAYVSKSSSFTYSQDAPEGFAWVDQNDGTSKLLAVLALDENDDNTAVLATNDGKTVVAQLTRTINGPTTTTDVFNTIALPFSVNATMMQEVFGDYALYSFTGADYDADKDHVTLNFTNAHDDGIAAGKAYLISVKETKANPVFAGVTISKEAVNSGNDVATFIPVLGLTQNIGTGMDYLYLGANNLLYFAEYDAPLKGFRGYFKLDQQKVPTSQPMSVSLAFDGEATGIKTVDNEQLTINNSSAWYTLDGQQLNAQPTQKGIYIHNGKKVIVK